MALKEIKTTILGTRITVLLLLTFFSAVAQDYPNMVAVKGGSFVMGNRHGDLDEQTEHVVQLSGFKIAVTETTVRQWRVYCEDTKRKLPSPPPWGWNDMDPMVMVSWMDAHDYVQWLSRKTGENYRLPTEAEWEFAAKGAASSGSTRFSGAATLEDVGWYAGNSDGKPRQVASKANNALGCYDLSGNVEEWCSDRYGSYPSNRTVNPTGRKSGFFVIARGGSWYNIAGRCTVTYRNKYVVSARNNYLGFRVAASLTSP